MPQGNLIANAPHMPVHLGSMGESIKTVIRENAGTMQPGDVYVLNDPYHGGTHLPDITVITPVYLGDSEAPMFYVGSRGHHADIGGTTPGSMPPFSTRIEEEGVQINNVKLVERGVLREAEMVALLQSGEYPSATPRRTWPISGRRSPPTRKACRNCARWWTSSAWTWCRPTCAMCRTTPRSRCAASSRA